MLLLIQASVMTYTHEPLTTRPNQMSHEEVAAHDGVTRELSKTDSPMVQIYRFLQRDGAPLSRGGKQQITSLPRTRS